jgi:hypothetical protein
MGQRFEDLLGTAILGIDTLWGGDVMCPSGTGRFIADSWFSDEPLPAAYTHSAAALVRETGGVSSKQPDKEAIDAYLAAIDIPAAIDGLKREAERLEGLRGDYIAGLALCFEVMWDLAMEIIGNAPAVPYERCVTASTGRSPQPSDPRPKRERVGKLLGEAGNAAVDRWRQSHRIPMASIRTLGAAVIAYLIN